MKRIFVILLSIILITALFACANKTNVNNESKTNENVVTKEKVNDGKFRIVTTIFPLYDYVKNIVGEDKDVEISMLIKSGIDMHSFNPSAADLKKIADCDMFIYIGGESDKWVKDAINSNINSVMKTINIMEALPQILAEEDDDDPHYGEHYVEPEKDEHVWLSLANAYEITNYIRKELVKIRTNKAAYYDKNTDLYLNKINDLDGEYQKMRDEAKKDTIVFADRFPFKYLCVDYLITYYAAFNGCSAESEASFEKVTSLAKKVDENKLNAVLVLEGNNQKLAKTVIENTEAKDAKILTMDSMQSVTEKDVKNGAKYLDYMKKNLETLKEALN